MWASEPAPRPEPVPRRLVLLPQSLPPSRKRPNRPWLPHRPYLILLVPLRRRQPSGHRRRHRLRPSPRRHRPQLPTQPFPWIRLTLRLLPPRRRSCPRRRLQALHLQQLRLLLQSLPGRQPRQRPHRQLRLQPVRPALQARHPLPAAFQQAECSSALAVAVESAPDPEDPLHDCSAHRFRDGHFQALP